MYSLRRRLLVSATLLLLVFLGVMAIGLNNAFKQSVLSNAEDALRNQVLLIIANVDVLDAQVDMPAVLSEPRLSQPDSDLFAQIFNSSGVVWRSPSLLDQSMPELAHTLGNFQFFQSHWWQAKPATYAITLGIEWETEAGDLPFTIQVAESSQAYTVRLRRYQRTVGIWLAVLGGFLLTLLLLLLRWVLKPLDKVAKQVVEIEEGVRQRFDQDYPMEVSRLTQNLNQLLSFEEQRINRQKEVLGNLAHSLKTPIAVLHGLKYSDQNKEEVSQQLGAVQNIIDYQLQSASAVGRRRFAKPIDIGKVTDQIVSSLGKLHRDKNLSVEVKIEPGTLFFGDEGDWMELAGNLLDNAYKWADSTVTVGVSKAKTTNAASPRSGITLVVEDDGAGIDDELKNTILQRGVRLDSQTPGHGLGLHIVKGIVEAYDGDISIENASAASGDASNGTRFSVTLQ